MFWQSSNNAILLFLTRIAPAAFEWALIGLPLAVYLLVLGMKINRGPRPHVVSGPRDFAWLCLGLSGFWLLGPPSWILHSLARTNSLTYLSGYLVYALALIFYAWLLAMARQSRTIIYNISPEAANEAVRTTLEKLSIPFTVTPGRVAFGEDQGLLDIESSGSLYCLTLSWRDTQAEVRSQFETIFTKTIATVATKRNPAGESLPYWGAVLLIYATNATVLFLWTQINAGA